jgi:hypothetical protein
MLTKWYNRYFLDVKLRPVIKGRIFLKRITTIVNLNLQLEKEKEGMRIS